MDVPIDKVFQNLQRCYFLCFHNITLNCVTLVPIIFYCPLESWIPFWNVEAIRGLLIRPYWPKLGYPIQKYYILYTLSPFVSSSLPKDNIFEEHILLNFISLITIVPTKMLA